MIVIMNMERFQIFIKHHESSINVQGGGGLYSILGVPESGFKEWGDY